jgi:hypothetical protein
MMPQAETLAVVIPDAPKARSGIHVPPKERTGIHGSRLSLRSAGMTAEFRGLAGLHP